MANRPIFVPQKESIGVKILDVEFEYFSGFSIDQKRKSINSLHQRAQLTGIKNILEVSTKSEVELGRELSAFNLKTRTLKRNIEFTVENAFQGSKVFQFGGPYIDLYQGDSLQAKKDERIKNSGALVEFRFFNYIFKLNPPTLFYDWLYINTLMKNPDFINKLRDYEAYSDIEFNPKRSINCQAYSLALFYSIMINDIELARLKDPLFMYEIAKEEYVNRWGMNFSHDVVINRRVV